MFYKNYIHTLLFKKKKASKETADLYARAIAVFSELDANTEGYTESQLVDHYQSFEMSVQRNNWSQAGLSEAHFLNAWLLAHTPPYSIENEKIKTNIAITQATNLYSKYHVPMALLLYHVKCAKCPKEDEVMNVWQSIHKSLKLEKGITIDEGAFETAALRLKEELPTDIIRGAFYSSAGSNDTGFECKYLLPHFKESLAPEKAHHILIVNPSPNMVEWCMEHLHHELSFAVWDDTISQLYASQFPQAKFIPFQTLVPNMEGERVTALLVNGRNWLLNRLDQPIADACAVCEEGATMTFSVSSALRKNAAVAKALSECQIQSVLQIPPQATQTVHRKKMLVQLEKMPKGWTAPENSQIPLTKSLYDTGSHNLFVSNHPALISYTSFWNKHNYTLNTLYNRAIQAECLSKKKDVDRRRTHNEKKFSEEITLRYTIQAERTHGFVGKAYYRQSDKVCIASESRSSPRVERGLRGETPEEVTGKIATAAFDKRIAPYIIDDLNARYQGKLNTVTLKTLWFYMRPQLKTVKAYHEDIALTLFCSETSTALSNLVIEMASQPELIAAMRAVFGDSPEEIPMGWWEQLNLIVEHCLRQGHLRFNPVASLFQRATTRATKRQQDVRNNLAKKTLSHQEIDDMLVFLFEEVTTATGETHPRYVCEDGWLSGAIRLLTGMSLGEVCGLKWKDLQKPPRMSYHQILISKSMSRDGTMEFYFGRKPQKLRILPLVAPLAKMITKRRDYLCNQGASGLDEHYMVYGYSEKILSNRQRVKRIKKACEEMVRKANISEILLRLPDENGEKLTDINSFIGDLLQHNYRYQANHVMKMNRGETQYLLGLAPPDTFYRHYCDMANPFVQLSMSIKMARWTATHKVFVHPVKQVLEKITPTLIKKMASRCAEARGNQVATLDFILQSNVDVEFYLTIKSDRGADVALTMRRETFSC